MARWVCCAEARLSAGSSLSVGVEVLGASLRSLATSHYNTLVDLVLTF